jgi:NitT/TauT family transport system ATP-binding protein
MQAESHTILTIDRLNVTYGALAAVEDISFSLREGEFVCLLGPTGCGKSTVLNSVGGFIQPQGGAIQFQGVPVVAPGPDRGVVFQDFVLFPWKTIQGNVEFALKFQGLTREIRRELSFRMLETVGLAKWARAYPHQLSGGMRQRVAIARCFVNRPKMLLMDEPFGSLDTQTRSLMQKLLLDIWQQFKTTVLFVTHDIEEAIYLADRLYVLTARPGQIKDEIIVPLDRPRPLEITVSDQFMQIKRNILNLIKTEVEEAVDRPDI